MSNNLRALLTCVEFYDFAAITIPYNIHHFSEFWVVSSMHDEATHDLCTTFREQGLPVYLVRTDRFYENGASFNKYAAIETALNVMERRGFITLMDADILWPKDLGDWKPEQGYLHTPYRRMMNDLTKPIPVEKDWGQFPVHPNVQEWAGYSQIFHADDSVLGFPPWHEVNWRHAGGGDSFFQAKWPANRKVRPPWYCLHLGPGCHDWCGRVRPFLDGTIHPNAAKRLQELRGLFAQRHRQPRHDRFRHERI